MKFSTRIGYAGIVGCIVLLCTISVMPSPEPELLFTIQARDFPETFSAVFLRSYDISPNGKRIAVVFETWEGKGGGVWLGFWDIESSRLISHIRLEGPDKNILVSAQETVDVRFSPDGSMVLVLTGSQLLSVNASSLDVIYSIKPKTTHREGVKPTFIRAFSNASDDSRIAVLDVYHKVHSRSSIVRIFNTDSGSLSREWTFKGTLTDISLSPDGQNVLLVARSVTPGEEVPPGVKNVLLVDADTGKRLAGLHTGYLAKDAEFLTGGRSVITVSANVGEWVHFPTDTVKIWDIDSGELIKELTYRKDGIRGSIAVGSKTTLIAACSGHSNVLELALDLSDVGGYNRLFVWDYVSGELIFVSPDITCGTERFFYNSLVRMSADGQVVAAGGTIVHIYRMNKSTKRP